MDTGLQRPPVAIILAAAASLALGALFFAPWLELCAEPRDEMKAGIYHFAPNLSSEIRQRLDGQVRSWPVAKATAADLTKGRLEAYRDKNDVPAIQEGFPQKRQWVLFGAILPAMFLLACAATVFRVVAKDRAGGYLVLGAIVGIVVMVLVASTDYYEDLRGRVEQEGNVRAASHDNEIAALTGTFRSMQILGGSDTFKTHATWYFWGALGLYGLVLGCGLACRLPEDPTPKPMVMGCEGPLLRHQLAFAARRPGPVEAGPSPPPDFGPDLGAEQSNDSPPDGTSPGRT